MFGSALTLTEVQYSNHFAPVADTHFLACRGKYAQLLAEQKSFTPEEEALFDASAQHAYESFRNKAASSRGMTPEAMQVMRPPGQCQQVGYVTSWQPAQLLGCLPHLACSWAGCPPACLPRSVRCTGSCYADNPHLLPSLDGLCCCWCVQEYAQGRVWSGQQAVTRGLIDELGGITRAIQIAKEAAGIAAADAVRVLEVSRAQVSSH